MPEKNDWVTLTNKHGHKVSIKYDKIVLLTESNPVESEIMGEVCHTLVECSDTLSVPVQEKRADIILLMNITESYLKGVQHGKHKRNR